LSGDINTQAAKAPVRTATTLTEQLAIQPDDATINGSGWSVGNVVT
jgi:hypothetical protein